MKCASLASAATLGILLASSSIAHANGRFPDANQILFSEHDPDLVMLRVTFGLLISHDRGKTFDWVCETSIGFSGSEDPMYAVTPSKNYIGTTFQGLTVSRDQACGWSFIGGDLANQVFIDLTSNAKDAKNVLVFASSYAQQDDAGNIQFTSRIWETKDEAQSFTQIGPAIDPGLLGYTVDLAPSDPNRIYVSAIRKPGATPEGALLTSKNHGQTWDEIAVPLGPFERAVFIAGVDPNDAERVYLRTSTNSDKPTRLIVREAVDGGVATLRTVYTATSSLLGFALSPDGKRVYIGGPKDGIKVASTTDFVFEERSKIEAQCLALNADGLWACSNERSGFIAGLSKDEGRTFTQITHFCDIRGPLACKQGTATGDQCPPAWPGQKAVLGCTDLDAGPARDGGQDQDDGGTTSIVASGSKSCDCRTAPAGPWGAVVAAVGAAIALLRRKGRRRNAP